MKNIINLTQHAATESQVMEGVKFPFLIGKVLTVYLHDIGGG